MVVTAPRDPDLTALAGTTDHLVAALRSIVHDDWASPTPCEEWDLAALVDHVTGGNWFTLGVLAGLTSEQAMAATVARFDAGSAGRDEAIRSAEEQRVAFEGAGVLDRSWHHVAGTLSGRAVLRLRLHDLIVHTWDIEQTIGPPAAIPDELVEWGLGDLADAGSLAAGHLQIAEPSRHRSSAGAAAAYLAAFGR